jgi:hypothetical protein
MSNLRSASVSLGLGVLGDYNAEYNAWLHVEYQTSCDSVSGNGARLSRS